MRRLPPLILVALSVTGIGGIDGFELSYGQDDNQGSAATDTTIPSKLLPKRTGG